MRIALTLVMIGLWISTYDVITAASQVQTISANSLDESKADDKDIILGKEGLAEQTGSFRRVASIVLIVGVLASVYVLYKKSS